MNIITIENKKYVLLPEEDYQSLKNQAKLKIKNQKGFSIPDARDYAYKLIDKWAQKEK